jgi:heme A synthase
MSDQEQPQPFRTQSEIAPTGATEEEEIRAARLANRFDIRRIIGGLFLVYSVVLIVTGIVGDFVVKHKASGINVNLYTGIGMLLFAIFMIAWALLRPTQPEPPETRGEGSGRIRRAPAT